MKNCILFILLTSLTSFNVKPISCLQMDIMLLGDFSSSVDTQYPFVTAAFNAFANEFDLSEEGMKIGAIGFSNHATLISPLTSDNEELQKGISEWHNVGGTTALGEALTMAEEQFQINGRSHFRKLIIIVSDGDPDDPANVMSITNKLKNSNIGICGVLIYGTTTKPLFMKTIASDFCYAEADYNNLITELKKLNICL